MTDNLRSAFYHRKNDTESFDSICGKCFQTIATRQTEEELKQAEEIHVCQPDSIEQLLRAT
jgi:hypothetical protein